MSKVHHLKTVNPHFQNVWIRLKHFEIRNNDRDFQVNDKIILEEYQLKPNKRLTGRKVHGIITYILSDYENVKKGYVVFSFVEIRRELPN